MSAQHGILALIFLLIFIQATAEPSSSNTLNLIKLLASSGRSPIIAIVQPKALPEVEYKLNDYSEGVMSTDDEEAKENAKIMLYDYLRSSPHDSKREKETKYALREALRQRCYKISMCIEECPLKRPKCPNVCEKKYDKERLCPASKGKTMPPKWLF